MGNMMRGISDWLGLSVAQDPRDLDDRDYEERYPEYRSSDRYRDDYDDDYGRDRAESRYSSGSSVRPYDHDDDYELGDSAARPHLRPLDRPVAPSVKHITPKTSFHDKYSEARVIGESFRDGDIVVFDLIDLEPEERKRYLDFAAGMAFALRGRIERDETRFTLLPEGVELSEADRDRLSV